MPVKCEACGGKGWLLADNSDHGLRIERCDACEQFDGDENAVKYVAGLAKHLEWWEVGEGKEVFKWTCDMCGMECLTVLGQMSIWRRIVHHLRSVHKMLGLPDVGQR